MIHDEIKSWMGLDPTNQDFTLGGQDIAGNTVGGTDFAYNTAEELYKSGDPLAQKLLRMNMQDSSPSMNSMLGMQSATGGSSSIGAMNFMQGQNRSQNNMAQALMGMRGKDISNSMGFNRQGMQGQQWTQGMDYQQELDNQSKQQQWADQVIGFGSKALLGPSGLAGTGFTGLFGQQGAGTDADPFKSGTSNWNQSRAGGGEGWWFN